ncbi:hypothetical protein C770_GR4pD0929 (plasmid) [Sinorhizobium meliloti GR4]|nr:hypothetical protein C770_GR4pD0929 [Sinorhizobium meliloti GR4]
MVDSDLPFTITAAPNHTVSGMSSYDRAGGAIVGKGIRDQQPARIISRPHIDCDRYSHRHPFPFSDVS